MRLTIRRLALTLSVMFCMVFMTVGFKGCSQAQKDTFVAYARDVADALQAAQPSIERLLPGKAAAFAAIIPKARRLVDAVAASNKTEALALVADIVPVVEEVAASLTNNPAVLAGLALANIGLHFLVNHLPTPITAQAATAKMLRLERFKAERVWGCDYYPERCK